jgi:DNA mismatch repair protein MutL
MSPASPPAEPVPRIAVLPDEIAGRIAAGEVIERPASVVKELIENALDAGARRIEVLIEGGGLELIRVSDDGSGIPADQLELAFARHGTSKLRSDDDLRRLGTLGFRGEALPSIAAAAFVTCQTRSSWDPLGVQACFEAGRLLRREPLARQPGTTVTVEELFAALPVRRRFLRARSTEAGQCAQVASHLALARPEVALRLVVDGRTAFQTAGDGDLRAAALAVRGAAFARDAADLGPLDLTDRSGALLARVSGLLGPPRDQRAARSGLSIFVNGRWVQNRSLAHAVEEGYRTAVRTGRHPVAIVFVSVPLEGVDVNVHPAKGEVRLLAEREIHAGLQRAVTAALPRLQHSWSEQGPLDERPGLDLGVEGLRILGQAGGTYIVAEGAQGLYLVDQHAAHERVLLEQLRAGAGQPAARQQLLAPEVVEVPLLAGLEPDQLSALLETLGFEAQPFGPASVLIRALPAVLAERQALGGLREAFAALAEAPPSADWRERLSLELACKTAVKSGDRLSPDEMQALLRRLGEAELAQHCAHGRPTSILLSHRQLARRFGRE